MNDLLAGRGEAHAIGREQGQTVADGIVHLVSREGSHRYLHMRGGTAMSVLQIVSADGLRGVVANVYTRPEARRSGLARELLEAARRDFREIEHNRDLTLAGADWATMVEGPSRSATIWTNR